MTTTSAPKVGQPAGLSVAHDRATMVAALVLRLAAAYLWYENLSWKNPPDFGQSDGGGLYGYTNGAITHPVLGVWTSIIQNVVLPHFTLFGWFTFLTEAGLALFLALGLATRLWALVGVLQSFAIYFTVGNLPNEWKWSYFLMAATHLAILGIAAGRTVGLDQILRARITGPSALARLYRLAS
jgi:thiosulfate dehydrogenase [quinone] large subunit